MLVIFIVIFVVAAISTLIFWNGGWDKIRVAVFASTVMGFVFLIPVYLGVKESSGEDYMILNGYVTGKEKKKVSCEHSYQCNCITTTINKTPTTTCQTCHEHNYDFAWIVKSSVGSSVIRNVDRRGEKEPPRFTQAIIGEPFSKQDTYFNYIRASPLSVFKDYNAYKDLETPTYPKVFDYYRVSHVVNWKSEYVSGVRSFDKMLAERLKVVSGKVKANVVVIFYGGDDSMIEATKVKNFGGRINDLTIMIKADKDGIIKRVGVFSWSKNSMVDVVIRDEIIGFGQLNDINNVKVVDMIGDTMLKYYQHRDKEEFKYLEANIEMPKWFLFYELFVAMVIICLNFVFRNKL